MASFTKVTSFHLIFIYLHFLFFLLFSFSEFPLALHGCHVEDKRALLDIKFALHDPSNRLASWKDGNQHDNCCDWQGIGCSNVSFRVTSINLRNTDLERYITEESNYFLTMQIPNTALRGRISSSLFNITYLEYLDLSYNDFQESQIPHQFSGLTKLSHLDLSLSNFSASISTQFTNLSSLHFLDLSCDEIHSYFWQTSCTKSSSTKWLKGLVNLQVLRLRGINSGIFDAPISLQHISYLSKLRDLDLSSCRISGSLFSINGFHNFSRLSSLKMNYNDLNSTIPNQLTNLTSLSILELSSCQLYGSVPYLPQLKVLDVSGNGDLHVDLNRMFKTQWPKLRTLWISGSKVNGSFLSLVSSASSLVSLSTSSCSIHGSLPSSFSNLSQLHYLDLSKNSIMGDVHSLISNLKYLYHLDLSHNKFQGTIPKSICENFPLQKLNLNDNNLIGTIPSCIKRLQHLKVFTASGNSIEGTVSLTSLINELNLSVLDLSSNRLAVVIDQPQRMYPILRLERLLLGSCNLKGFPTSMICNLTHLWELDLSDNNLTGAIPSCLYKLKYLYSLDLSRNILTGAIPRSLSKLKSLDTLYLSNNKFHGPLPLLPQNMSTIDLSNNQFDGEISIETGKILTSCHSINLSGNKFSGSSLSSLCLTDPGIYAHVFDLNLSNNNLSGSIPSSIGNCITLFFLNLGNNKLTGIFPKDIGILYFSLEVLQLNGNNLDGTLDFFCKLQGLQILNLADNNFGGNIPTGLGSLQYLKVLSLRSNKLSGSIPEEIIHLQKLQILDLSINNLSGPIPRNMGNLKRLSSRSNDAVPLEWGNDPSQFEMMIKGNIVQLKHLYSYSSGIDLSCNLLDGNIPEQIGSLKELVVLNLSHNCFSGNIPMSIGEMSGLESLDLSSNGLSGPIPQSFAGIDSLQFLNVSYNKLSGKIPRGNHFDTLGSEGLAFAGNKLLCGYPTKKPCKGDHNTRINDANPRNGVDEVDREDAKEKLLLYAIVALGIAVGFWGLFFVLLLKKKKWWFPYWRYVHSIAVRITSYFLNKR